MEENPPRILFVEDNESHAELIRRCFAKSEGPWETAFVQTLAQARDYIERQVPQLVVADLRLPDGEGTELLADADQPSQGGLPYPIVIMTGQGDETKAVAAMKAGALDYVVKSADTLADMSRVVARALREWGHIQGLRRAERELRDRELQLTHVARLSTMGEMVAGISHELSQPLYAIGNFASACVNVMQGDSSDSAQKVVKWADKIATESDRAGEIIRRLREFTRATPPDCRPVDLNALVIESIELVAFLARERRVRVETHLDERLPVVSVDRILLQQVLVNLLNNAHDAVRDVEKGKRVILVETVGDDSSVSVSVRDSGPGIAVEDPEQLFETFFTTKENGMGMGLAISRGIIDQHGGRLWAMPAEGSGATFQFTLPVVPAKQSGGTSPGGAAGCE